MYEKTGKPITDVAVGDVIRERHIGGRERRVNEVTRRPETGAILWVRCAGIASGRETFVRAKTLKRYDIVSMVREGA